MPEYMYSFFRRIQDNSGQLVGQVVSVYAGNPSEARLLLERELAGVRDELGKLPKDLRQREPSFEEIPEWTIDEIVLDKPKVVSFFVT